jgi:adenine-specific DNA-methyltransferase
MAKEQPEKLTGTSLDISAENRTRLKALFPAVFTETRNDKGDLVESIDFEKLKAELGTFSDLFESRRERYGMDWPGKKEALRLIQTPSAATLRPCREESVNFDTTGNLFIEGDNLEVLKLLQNSYYGKVKMIVIDPPYNTGKEFIYPDNFSESLQTYLEYAGLIDGDGKKFSTNTANEGRFHTKWLNMMYPRLYLARNLLRDDGVIFIHIDDNEVSNLRKLCDEIFGEDNFLAQIIWQKIHSTKNDAKYYSDTHEYILCYSKNIDLAEIKLLPRTESMDSRFTNPDNDPHGAWASGDLVANEERSEGYYDVVGPTGKVFNVPKGKHWVYAEANFKRMIAENRIWFGKNNDAFPRLKRYLSEVQQGRKADTLWLSSEVGHNQESKREIIKLFDGFAYFDTPKPVRLILKQAQL